MRRKVLQDGDENSTSTAAAVELADDADKQVRRDQIHVHC